MSETVSNDSSSGGENIVYLATASQPPKPTMYSGGSGSGGGKQVDAETKNYVDAKMDSVRAQNDARFAEVLARLDNIKVPSLWQLVSIGAGMVLAFVTVVGLMADRFDGGLAASSVIAPMTEAQNERDAIQDKKLDTILWKIEALNEKLEPSEKPVNDEPTP
jgi:hypothetical protein